MSYAMMVALLITTATALFGLLLYALYRRYATPESEKKLRKQAYSIYPKGTVIYDRKYAVLLRMNDNEAYRVVTFPERYRRAERHEAELLAVSKDKNYCKHVAEDFGGNQLY